MKIGGLLLHDNRWWICTHLSPLYQFEPVIKRGKTVERFCIKKPICQITGSLTHCIIGNWLINGYRIIEFDDRYISILWV